jgi:hypothetical protein
MSLDADSSSVKRLEVRVLSLPWCSVAQLENSGAGSKSMLFRFLTKDYGFETHGCLGNSPILDTSSNASFSFNA